MNTTGVILTYREYAALPADGRRYEIHEGELSMTAAPSPQHQIVCANLFSVLRMHVKSRQIERFSSPRWTSS
ncbi:MAG: Uma2 family endonuclease [candidate division NC10 bacterium]|nr:Uma2 family endonuclease [candidate division NC10 bacterium]